MTDDAWRDPDDIKNDLTSGDPERMMVGIVQLIEFNKPGDELEVIALEPWMLHLFGVSPPDELVTAFARLLASYRSFIPQPSRAYVIRQLVELAVRYGVGQVIYETSLAIQGQVDPPTAARDALGYLRMRGLTTQPEIGAAETLISYLLEAKLPVRRATTEAFAAWPSLEAKQQIALAVLPLVDPDQRALLQNPPERPRLPPMNFQDVAVSRRERFALGLEQNSGKYYLAIPATNGLIDYSEYYEIGGDLFEKFRVDLDSALPWAIRIRDRLEEPRLMYQPSTRRGTPL